MTAADSLPDAVVRILSDDPAGGANTLDQLRDPETGARLAPVRADGSAVAGLPQGQGEPLLAVVDTGLDSSHPWIASTLVDWVDLTGQGEEDRNGHGTWVALTFLSTSPMPCGLLNVKALGDDGTGTVDALARAIRWAARRGAKYINISAGVSQPSCQADCPLCQAVLSAAYGGAEVTAAAGNVAGETTCPAKAGILHPGSRVRAVGARNGGTWAPQPYSGIGNGYLPDGGPTVMPILPAGDERAGWDPKYRAASASTLMRLALAAASLGNMNDATRRLDEVIGRCGDDPQPEVRAYAVSALIYKGFMFGQNGSPQQGLACYGSVVERYGADPAEVIRNVVAQARSRRAAVLEQLGDTEGALADYGAIIGDGPLSPGTTPWRERARELLNRGFLLQALGRWEEAEVDFRRLVADYADLATGEMELWVARAKVNLGVGLSEQGDEASALTEYDEVWERWGDSPSPDMRREAAAAMFNRGNFLRRLGRKQEAAAAYDQVVARYGDDPAAVDVVEGTRANRAALGAEA